MQAAWRDPLIATASDPLFGLSSTIAQHISTVEPMTWTLVIIVTGALGIFVARRTR